MLGSKTFPTLTIDFPLKGMLSTPIVPNEDYTLVYEPAEDSFLFLDLFESLKESCYLLNKRFSHKSPLVLEIGSGSGIISTFLKMHNLIPNSFHLASDINEKCNAKTMETLVHNCASSKSHFDVLRGDLVSAIKDHSLDLLLFNPPYVPSEDVPELPVDTSNDTWLDLALIGGKDGMLITNKLLLELDRVLAVMGEAYILFCARNNHKEVTQDFAAKYPNFSVEQVIFRKCGWEELSIYRFTKLS